MCHAQKIAAGGQHTCVPHPPPYSCPYPCPYCTLSPFLLAAAHVRASFPHPLALRVPLLYQRAPPPPPAPSPYACPYRTDARGGGRSCVLYGDPECSNCNSGFMRCFGGNLYGQVRFYNTPNAFRNLVVPTTHPTRLGTS